MDFVFAIPTYNRPNEQLTVEYLSSCGVDKDLIYCFVQTKEDETKIKKKYGNLCNVVFGKANSHSSNCNNAFSYFDEGAKIVLIDDDVKSLDYLSKDGKKLIKVEDADKLFSIITKCFKYAINKGAYIWGVYPVHNAFFMKHSVDDKNLCISAIWGVVNKYKMNEAFRVKGDYELCCRMINEGLNVVRFNNLALNAKHYSKGGCEDDWKNDEVTEKCCNMLLEMYPNIVVPHSSRKNEVRFVYGKKVCVRKTKVDKKDDDSELKRNYQSPRWSGEIADCSMPMTFDTYSNCSFGCVYCFSQFQRGLGSNNPDAYFGKSVRSVDPERVKKIFTFENESQFSEYVRQRKTFQWGGLSDQFDGFEKKYGITFDLLKFFKEQNYPICFSTKSTWWLDDDRYTSLFRGQKNWNCKFSIITNDDDAASKIEVGVPSSTERIEAIRKFSELGAGGATLRLRPFIIGVTSRNYLELIERAYDAGATAVTTEFLCIENRAAHIPEIKKHYDVLSEECGFDILKFYNKYSYGSGYLRLNRKIKEPYIKKMQELCRKLGMRFYVSDAHFKEACDGSCCCGLPESWNYSRGNFSYALQLCKKNGSVRFSEIREDLGFLENVQFNKAEAFNTGSSERRAKFEDMSLVDYLRYLWNNPNAGQSPCKMFEKVMYPDGYDENGDIIYRYNKDVTYVR